MLGVSRSDWRICLACAAKALLASVCDLYGFGASLTNLLRVMTVSMLGGFISDQHPTYLIASASIAQTTQLSSVRSWIRSRSVGIW